MPESKRSSKNLIESFRAIAESANSHNAIESYLSMAPRFPQHVFIRQYIVYHKEDLLESIERKTPNFPYVNVLQKNPLVFEIKRPETQTRSAVSGVLTVLPSSQTNISRITTISYSNFWNIGVKPLIKKIYPKGMPVFFRQDEIESSLYKVEETLGSDYRIRIADVTLKEERSNSQESRRKIFDTERRWTDLPIKDIFSQAKERNQWFTGLSFIIQKKRKNTRANLQVSKGRLNKYGEVSFNSFYNELISSLLFTLESYAGDRFKLLQKRGIRERGYDPSIPIEISYSYEAFSRIEEVRRFGKIISSYPNSTKAVFHSNPYYHASVADFLDGSSFDIWVLSDRRIVIIPQAKSSAQAFERLISHIFSNFGEGTV